MRRLAFSLIVLALMVAAGSTATAAPGWWRALAYIGQDGNCTAFAVRPRLLATASHCVGYPTSEYDVYRLEGINVRKARGVVVWDSVQSNIYSDLALIVVDKDWPSTLPVARQVPGDGVGLQTAGYAVGIATWETRLTSRGLRYYIDLAQWILLFEGMLGPGSSGSPVLNLQGEVVAVHTLGFTGIRGLGAGVMGGSPAGYLGYAIRDYERHGPQHGWWDAPPVDDNLSRR